MSPSDLVGTVLDGKFQIEKALASGAAGDVFEALHLDLGARVAVKVLRPGIPETADIRRKRFMREARVAARIKSDHVVRVFDVVAREQGPTYIVMELLVGETLAERVRRAGPLPVAEAVDFLLQATKPLVELHDAGIVHRDVKPSNLFLARDADGKDRIKLLDFGVAAFQQPVHRGESSLTLSEVVVGTPRYMAPEQVVAARNVDARADVWALGVTLYELLAGTPPFDGQTVLAVLNQIEQQEPRGLAAARPGVPEELAGVVHRCLAKDPAGRPADARALAAALAPFGESAPASGRGVEAVLPATARRDRSRMALVACAGLGMAGLLAVALRRPAEAPAQAALPASGATLAPAVLEPPPAAPSGPAAAAAPDDAPAPPPTASAPTASTRPTAAQRRTVGRPPPRPPASRPPRKPSEDDDRIE
ncbi:MAG TPA: serine/threonine-protein kinase [Polyangiaceae bacterium]|jgi:serine/threonine-protein kinase